MNFWVQSKTINIFSHKSRSDNNYWDCSGTIFSLLKYSLQEYISYSHYDLNSSLLHFENNITEGGGGVLPQNFIL